MSTETTSNASERYAELHRLIEKGQDDEDTWAQLTLACIGLDRREEALEGFARVHAPGVRRDLQDRLADRGWTKPVRRTQARTVAVTEADLSLSTTEKLQESLQFLFEPRLRRAAVLGTIAFPLSLALGGLLTAAGPWSLLRLVAAVPPLLLVGMVAAFGRHLLAHAVRASDDARELPDLRTLWREGPRALREVMAAATAFVAPAAALALLDETGLALLLLAASAFLLPAAVALRCTGHAWRQITPRLLLASVRPMPSYVCLARVVTLLFIPAMAAFVAALGQPLFILVSVVGPLSVVPFLVAMRMLGWTLHYEGARLARPPAKPAARPGAHSPIGATGSTPPTPAPPS